MCVWCVCVCVRAAKHNVALMESQEHSARHGDGGMGGHAVRMGGCGQGGWDGEQHGDGAQEHAGMGTGGGASEGVRGHIWGPSHPTISAQQQNSPCVRVRHGGKSIDPTYPT